MEILGWIFLIFIAFAAYRIYINRKNKIELAQRIIIFNDECEVAIDNMLQYGENVTTKESLEYIKNKYTLEILKRVKLIMELDNNLPRLVALTQTIAFFFVIECKDAVNGDIENYAALMKRGVSKELIEKYAALMESDAS